MPLQLLMLRIWEIQESHLFSLNNFSKQKYIFLLKICYKILSHLFIFFPFLVYDIWPKVLHRSDCFPKSIFYFWKKRWGNLLPCLASPKESLSCNSKFHYKINQDNINTMFNILYFLKLSKKNKQFTKVQISQTVSVITLCNKISQEVSWNRYYNR